MGSWERLSRATILDRGKFLKVESHRVRLPDGRTIDDWPWLITPDYVNVVAELEDGRFLFFRQFKYAVGGLTLAPVGGYVDLGEVPSGAARRELKEETGCEAREWISLGSYPVDGNRGAGNAHLFLARGVRKIADRTADDLEEQEVVLLTRSETEEALHGGRFGVLPWAAAVALALCFSPTTR
jgi:ADP-ribose diphosphatase